MDINLLETLINTNSVFPNEYNVSTVIDKWISENVSCKSNDWVIDKNRRNIAYTKGSKKKSILLIGHLDTIAPVEGWKTDPFKAILKEGNLFGLGAWDMKGGLYVLLQVLKKFEPKNFTLKVAFTVDEENISQGAYHLVDSGYCDDAQLVLVPEVGFDYGESGIVIGRSGRSVYEVKILGESSHGSRIRSGTNAIDEAYSYLNALKKLKFKASGKRKTVIFPRGMNALSKGFSVPDECMLELDCVLNYPDTPESVLNNLKDLSRKLHETNVLIHMPEVEYKKRDTPFCLPYCLDKKNYFVKVCINSVKKVAGKAVVYSRNSIADECIYVNKLKIPAVCIGPSGENAHKANESVSIESLIKLEKIYLNILAEIDSSNILL